MATIRKRNDSYIIRVSCGYDSKGKQIEKYMTWKPSAGMTQKQVDKELERQKVLFEEKCLNGSVLNSSIKFADFAEYWLTEYADKQLRPTTVDGYKLMLKRIIPAIGHIRLDKIQPKHLMEFYNNLQEGGIREDKKYTCIINLRDYLKENGISQIELSNRSGVSIKTVYAISNGDNITELSAVKVSESLKRPLKKLFKVASDDGKKLAPKTILHHHRLISSILETAVKWQVLFNNPCDRVETPKVERKEARYLDEYQATELLNYLESEQLQYKTMIILLLYSGMRRGELCGLEWNDIDFDNCIVDINKSSLYIKGKGIYNDETKNFSSNRVIKVPQFVMQLIAEHKLAQSIERFRLGDQWEDSNKLFTQWNGKPIHPDTITNWFKSFIKRNNLPDITLHSLRHTNATLMIASGVDLRTVSKRLGHAQMSTTTDIYTHAIQTADERASDILDDILTVKKNNKKA
jgi:Site-specific recombinase XerD